MPPLEWLMRRSMKKVFESSQHHLSFPFSLSLSPCMPDMKFQIRGPKRDGGGGLNTTTAYSFIRGPTNHPTSASFGPVISSEHLNSELESTKARDRPTLVLKLSPGTNYGACTCEGGERSRAKGKSHPQPIARESD